MVGTAKAESPVEHSHHLLPSRRQTVLQIVIGTIVLISGMAIGCGGTILFLKDRILWRSYVPGIPPTASVVEQWQSEYGLTDEQAQKMKAIFDKHVDSRHARWAAMNEKDQADREEFAKSVKTVMSAEQFERWEQDLQKRAEQFRMMRMPGRRGPRQRGPSPGPRGPRGPEPPAHPNGYGEHP